MATFTEPQVSDIAEILGTNSDLLGAHLDYYASVITESDTTKITEQITRYQNGTVEGGVWFEGNEANEGFNMARVNIADNRNPAEVIANLIQWQTIAVGSRFVRA